MIEGCPHGIGNKIFDNGDKYTGSFELGKF